MDVIFSRGVKVWQISKILCWQYAESMKTQGKSVSDEELVEKIRREDTELYREIVGRHQRGLYRYLRHFTNRPDAAEDLVQDVLYLRLHLYDSMRCCSSSPKKCAVSL